jgi:hypothetical protein
MATPKKPIRRFTPPEPADAPALTPLTHTAEPPIPVLAIPPKEEWLVNGKRIPDHLAHLINFDMTDQGIAHSKATRKTPEPVVEMLSDAWDKTLARKGDAEPWDSFDPLTEAVDRVREPGFTYRALSTRVCDKRSTRGWEKVLDKDGRDVKVGNLFIAKMPIERAEKRNAHYRAISEDAVREAAEQYAVGQEKIVRDAGVGGLAPLRVGDTVSDRENPSLSTSIGIDTRRGTTGQAA